MSDLTLLLVWVDKLNSLKYCTLMQYELVPT